MLISAQNVLLKTRPQACTVQETIFALWKPVLLILKDCSKTHDPRSLLITWKRYLPMQPTSSTTTDRQGMESIPWTAVSLTAIC